MDASGPVRFAVIGCGMLARSQHIPNLANSTKADLAVCCDVDESALEVCRAQYSGVRTTTDYLEAVQDAKVDAVCLATTEKLRYPVIEAAIRAGKPVYVEKPLATSPEAITRIRDLVRGAGIPFCVGHNRRCSPALMRGREIFRRHMEHPGPCPWRFDREGADRPRLKDDGVAAMSIRINDDWYSWKGWVFDKTQAPHGPMLFEMTHFTDICNWFLAARPTEVMAMEHGMMNRAVAIRYEHGEMATISMAANGSFGFGKELFEVMGNGGFMRIDHLLEIQTAGIADAPARTTFPMVNDRHPHVGAEGGMSGWLAKKRAACEEAAAAGDPTLQFTAEPDRGHAQALDAFVDEIRGVGPVVCGIEDAVLATQVAFAAIRSAHEGRAVPVDAA